MNHFSPSASSVLDRALSFAQQLGQTYVGSEHLLLGLLAEKGTAASGFLPTRSHAFRNPWSAHRTLGNGIPHIAVGRRHDSAPSLHSGGGRC